MLNVRCVRFVNTLRINLSFKENKRLATVSSDDAPVPCMWRELEPLAQISRHGLSVTQMYESVFPRQPCLAHDNNPKHLKASCVVPCQGAASFFFTVNVEKQIFSCGRTYWVNEGVYCVQNQTCQSNRVLSSKICYITVVTTVAGYK